MAEIFKGFLVRVAAMFVLFIALYAAAKGYEHWGNLCFSYSCRQAPGSFVDYAKVYSAEVGVVLAAAVALPLLGLAIALVLELLKILGMVVIGATTIALLGLAGWGIYSAFEAYGFVKGIFAILGGGIALWLMSQSFSVPREKFKYRKSVPGFSSEGKPPVPFDTSPNPYANPDPSRPDGGNPYANP